MAKAREVFKQKKSFELEDAKALQKDVEVVLQDLEIYHSKKYNSAFGVIQGANGELYYTWSTVVCDKLDQLKYMDEEDYRGLPLKAVEKSSQETGRTYLDLVLND